MSTLFQSITDSKYFQNTVITVILCSTLLVGLETIPTIRADYLPLLNFFDTLILGLFTLELAIRIAAYGKHPWRFFTDVWNLFDFTIVAVCYLPSGQFAAALRIVRILRVLRLLASVQKAEIERLKNVELTQAYQALAEEKARSERLLLNILPQLVASRLKEGQIIADSHEDVTVLFADIVGFTELSSELSAEELVDILDEVFCCFDTLADKHGVETIGDAYMAVAGVPEPYPDHAQRVAGMACDILRNLGDFNKKHDLNLQVRIGFHCGPVVAGIIGQKKFIYDLWGDTVNIASRMESHGVPGAIQVSQAVVAHLDDSYRFEARGTVKIKGKGEMYTYLLHCES